MKLLHMQSKSPLLAGCFILVITILMLPAAARRAAGEEPPVFAITNAKVIPVSAPTIEKGTVDHTRRNHRGRRSGRANPG